MTESSWNAEYARGVEGSRARVCIPGRSLMLIMEGRRRAGADPGLASHRYLPRRGFLGLKLFNSPQKIHDHGF